MASYRYRTILVILQKDCYLGQKGERVRLPEKEAERAIGGGYAERFAWNHGLRTAPKPDVVKHGS